MPRFKDKKYNELKQYLEIILGEQNINKILDSIVNKDTEKLWSFVVGYKLIVRNLEKLTIDDPELAYLVGQFLGNYHAVETLYNKYEKKKNFENKMDEYITKSVIGVDILSDLFVAPAISYSILSSNYNENISKELEELIKNNIISSIENEQECCYMLTDQSRRYMMEKYFPNMNIDENQNQIQDSYKAKILHLLRKENKKESELDEKNTNK